MLDRPHRNWRCHRSDDVTMISFGGLVKNLDQYENNGKGWNLHIYCPVFHKKAFICSCTDLEQHFALSSSTAILSSSLHHHHHHHHITITITIDIHLCPNSSGERISSHPVASRPDQALQILKMMKITMMVMVMTMKIMPKYCPNVANTFMILL